MTNRNEIELRTEVGDLVLALTTASAAILWGAEVQLAATADELAAAYPDGRPVTYVGAMPDDGAPYALDGYVVDVPGGRLGVELRSRLTQRPATADEVAAMRGSLPLPIKVRR